MARKKDKYVENALKHLSKGNYSKAIKEYKKVLELDPKDHKAWQKLGDCYLKSKDKLESIKNYHKAASLYYRDGFYHKAQAIYKQILSIDNDNVNARMDLADVCQKLGYMNEALIQYKHIAEIYDKKGKDEDALEIYQKMSQLDPTNTNARMKLAELYFKKGDRDRGYKEFQTVSDELRTSGRHDELVRMLEKLIKQDPTRADNYKAISEVYSEKGQYDKAAEALEHLLKNNPEDTELLEKLVDVQIRNRDIDAIKATLRRLAGVLKSQGMDDKAEECIKRILKFDPSDEEALAVAGEKAPAEESVSEQPDAVCDPGADEPVLEDDPIVYEEEEEEIEALAPGDDEELMDAGPRMEPDPVEARSKASDDPFSPTEASPGVSAQPDMSAPKDKDEIAKMITEADVYIKYGLTDRSIQIIDEVLSQVANHPVATIKKAEILRNGGNKIEAENLLFNAATGEHENGNLANAKFIYDEILRLDPSNSLASDALSQFEGEVDLEMEQADQAAPVSKEPPAMDKEYDEDALVLADDDELTFTVEEEAQAAPPPAEEEAADDDTLELAPDDEDIGPPETLVEAPETVDASPAEDISDDTSAFAVEGEERHEQQAAVDDSIIEEEVEEGPVIEQKSQDDLVLEEAVEEEPAEPLGPEDPEPEPEPVSEALPEEPVEEEEEYAEQLEEVRFFMETGQKGEAKKILRRILLLDPDCEAADALMDQVDAMEESAPEPPATVAEEPATEEAEERAAEPEPRADEPVPEEAAEPDPRADEPVPEEAAEPEPRADEPVPEEASEPEQEDAQASKEEGIFDLAAELEGEDLFAGLDAGPSEESVEDEEMRSQISAFTEGASRQMGGDADGHFDLGIAYKEMDLIDEAVDAFNKAIESGGNPVQCLNMIAICYKSRGRFVQAEEALLNALGQPELTEAEIMNLKFEFGELKDSLGQKDEALMSFLEAAEISEKLMKNTKDKKEKKVLVERDKAAMVYIEKLKVELGDKAEEVAGIAKSGGKKKPKKSKVSYI